MSSRIWITCITFILVVISANAQITIRNPASCTINAYNIDNALNVNGFSSTLILPTDFTINFWFKRRPTNSNRALFFVSENLFLEQVATGPQDGDFQVGDGGTTRLFNAEAQLNTMRFISWRHGQATSSLCVYESASTVSCSSVPRTDHSHQNEYLMFFRNPTQSHPTYGTFGAIHIWDHIRTNDQVMHEFQNGISGFESGLLGYYDMHRTTMKSIEPTIVGPTLTRTVAHFSTGLGDTNGGVNDVDVVVAKPRFVLYWGFDTTIPTPNYVNDVVLFSAGTVHCIAVTANQHVYAWGANDKKQLGLADATVTPTKLDHASLSGPIRMVKLVEKMSFILMENNKLYGFGDCSRKLLLADCTTMLAEPTEIATDIVTFDCSTSICIAKLVNGKLKEWGLRNVEHTVPFGMSVNTIVVTTYSAAYLTNEGYVFTIYGAIDSYELGLGSNAYGVTSFRKVQRLAQHKIVTLIGSHQGYMAMNEFGDWFYWGVNLYGRFGAGHSVLTKTPTIHPVMKGGTASLGKDHLLWIAPDGKVYSSGRCGLLGYSCSIGSNPTLQTIDILNGNVVAVLATDTNSLAISGEYCNGRAGVDACTTRCGSCDIGSDGPNCNNFTCSCDYGTCVGPDKCKCDLGYGGPTCAESSLLGVTAPPTAEYYTSLTPINGDFSYNASRLYHTFIGTRQEFPNHDWYTDGPFPHVTEYFASKWNTTIAPGHYTFVTQSDDGIRVTVGDVIVISRWIAHGATRDTNSINVVNTTQLLIEHNELGSLALADVRWSNDTMSLRPIGMNDDMLKHTSVLQALDFFGLHCTIICSVDIGSILHTVPTIQQLCSSRYADCTNGFITALRLTDLNLQGMITTNYAAFSAFPELKTLDLSNNRFNTLLRSQVYGYPYWIDTLNLANNSFSNFYQFSYLGYYPTMRINLTGNPLCSPPTPGWWGNDRNRFILDESARLLCDDTNRTECTLIPFEEHNVINVAKYFGEIILSFAFSSAFGPECFTLASDPKWRFRITFGSSHSTAAPTSRSTSNTPARMTARLQESTLRSYSGFSDGVPLHFSVGFIWNDNGGYFITEQIALKYATSRQWIASVMPWVIPASTSTPVIVNFTLSDVYHTAAKFWCEYDEVAPHAVQESSFDSVRCLINANSVSTGYKELALSISQSSSLASSPAEPMSINSVSIYVVSSLKANVQAVEWPASSTIVVMRSTVNDASTRLMIPAVYRNATFTLDIETGGSSPAIYSLPCTVNQINGQFSCEKTSLSPPSGKPILLSSAIRLKQDSIIAATLSEPMLLYSTASASVPLFGIGTQVVVTFSQSILVSQPQIIYRAWDTVSNSDFSCEYQTQSSLACNLTRTKSAFEPEAYSLTIQISAPQLDPSLWITISSQPVQHYSLGGIPSLKAPTKIYATTGSPVVRLNSNLPAAVRSMVNCSIDGIIGTAKLQQLANEYECVNTIAQPGLRSVSLMFIEPDTNTSITISESVSVAFVDMGGSFDSSTSNTTVFVPGNNISFTFTGMRMVAFATESYHCKYGPDSSPMLYNSTATSVENSTPGETSAEHSKFRVTCYIASAESAKFTVSLWITPFISDQNNQLRVSVNTLTLYVLPHTALTWGSSQAKAEYTTASPVLATITLQKSLHEDIGLSNRIYCRNVESRTQSKSDVLIQWHSATTIKCNIDSQITTKVTTTLWYIHDGVELELSTSGVQFAFINRGSAANQIGTTAHPNPNAAIITQSVVSAIFDIDFDASMLIAATPAVADMYMCRYNNGIARSINVSSFVSDGSRTNFTCEFPSDDHLQQSQSQAVNVTLWINVNDEDLLITEWVFRFYFIQQAIPTWFDSGFDTVTTSPSVHVNVKLDFAVSEELLQQAVCAQNPLSKPNERQIVPTSIADPALRKYNCALSQPSPIGRIELSLLFPVRKGATTGYLEITTSRLVFTFLPSITLLSLSPSLSTTTTGLTTVLTTTMPTLATDFPDIAFHCNWNGTANDGNIEANSSAVWNAPMGTFTCTVSGAASQRVSIAVTATVHNVTLVLSENTLFATLVHPTAAVYAETNTAAATLHSTFDVKIQVPFATDFNMIRRTSCKQSGIVVPLQYPESGDGAYTCSLSGEIASSLGSNVHPITLWYTDDYGMTLEITGTYTVGSESVVHD